MAWCSEACCPSLAPRLPTSLLICALWVLACIPIHPHDPVPSRDDLLPRLSSISGLFLSRSSISNPWAAQASPSSVWRGLQKPSPGFVWLPFPCQASSWAPVGCLRCHLLLTSTWLCSWKVLWLSIASTQRQSLLTTCPLTSKVQRQLLLLLFSCFFFLLEFTPSVVPWDWEGVVATIHPLPASSPHAHESNTMNDIP